jgi:transposase
MDQPSIFSSTLGLSTPWRITKVEVSKETARLDIYISCCHSFSMTCPSCGNEARVCRLSDESWHHTDFFNKEAFIHAKVPLITCDNPCGCLKIQVPWSKPGSRFIRIKETLPTSCTSCNKAGTFGLINPS